MESSERIEDIIFVDGRPALDPWVRKIPRRRKWLLTPVFLPEESPWTEEPGGLQSCCAWSLNHIQLFSTSWTVACQEPLFMGIFQARILEWVAMPSFRGSSQPRNRTQVSHISGRFFTIWATREAKNTRMGNLSLLHGNFLTQEWKRGLLHFWWILHQLSYQGYSLWGHEELDFTEQLTLSWGELCPPKKMC